MLNDATCFKQVYIVCGYTDLRSGIDTLASIVDAKTDNSPYVPDTLYLFCGRKSDRIKGLVWEKDGFLLLYKCLEQGKFVWPRNESEVQAITSQQSQLQDIDRKLQLLLEQVAVLNNNRFGKSSEKLDAENQICFMEVDGNIVFFNEAEAVASLNEYVDEDETKPRGRKTKGKREKDIRGLPVNPVEHKMSEEELIAEFGEDGWYELEDEIY